MILPTLMGPFRIKICQISDQDPVIHGWPLILVFKCVMRRSCIAEYGSRWRSDSATTRTFFLKKALNSR